MKKLIMLLLATTLFFSCGEDDSVSTLSSGIEGKWEAAPKDPENSPKFWRIEFTGNKMYQNKIDIEGDGSERVEWIGIGTYRTTEDSLYMILEESYESHGGYEFTKENNDEPIELGVTYSLTDGKLIANGLENRRVTSKVMRKP